jgi:hypothetical protein
MSETSILHNTDDDTPQQQRKWFITFGGPTENYHNAVKRICQEASGFDVFDETIGYTEQDLMSDDSFWSKHRYFIESNACQGYGFWLWKPYLTKKTLERMNDNDILLYADAGCYMNKDGKARLLEYFNMLNTNETIGNISFQMVHLEELFTKMDILDYYNAIDPTIMKSGQIVGGVFVLRKCQHTIELIDKWYDGCCRYHLLDDSCGKLSNVPSYHIARNDQSIFSVIRKKYGTIALSDETWFGPQWTVSGKDYPIWAIRKRE